MFFLESYEFQGEKRYFKQTESAGGNGVFPVAKPEECMVWDVSYTCDICGKKKGEVNHWWMVMLGDVPCWEEDQPSKRFTLLPWNAAESQREDIYHLCGQGCAMQAMERFMNTGSIAQEEPVAKQSAAKRMETV